MSLSWLPRGDAVGGVALILATILALTFSNSSLSPLYTALLETKISISVGTFELTKPLLLWINDGMMAVFFFLVGLELKRELLEMIREDLAPYTRKEQARSSLTAAAAP